MSGVLPEGMPVPVASPDGLDAPDYEGLADGVLRIQRCRTCQGWQWGPEWICHHCHSFNLGWVEVGQRGRIYSWERSHHPVHPALKDQGPYIVVLVELPHADNVRMVGNLLGDPEQDVPIGAPVEGVFEHHEDADPAFTLVHWRLT